MDSPFWYGIRVFHAKSQFLFHAGRTVHLPVVRYVSCLIRKMFLLQGIFLISIKAVFL